MKKEKKPVEVTVTTRSRVKGELGGEGSLGERGLGASKPKVSFLRHFFSALKGSLNYDSSDCYYCSDL